MTTTTTTTPPATRRGTGGLLAALVLGIVAAILDTTIVAVGLRTLSDDLGAPLSTIQWVSTGYLLSLAVAIPLVGWAQRRFGGKRLWLFALGLFTIASLLCACAPNAGWLIAFRVFQGFGAGIMFPLMQTLAMQNVPDGERPRAMATVALPAALGPILGPVLGGIVLNWLSWPFLFLINVPIGIVGLAVALRYIPADHEDGGRRSAPLDILGFALIAPGLTGLLYGLSRVGGEADTGLVGALVPLVAGVVLLTAFAIRALRSAGATLVDVRLLGVSSVRASSIALALFGSAMFGSMFLLPIYFQTLHGYSVLGAALFLIPQGVGSLLVRIVAGRLVTRFGARAIAVVGFAVVAAVTVPFALSDANTPLAVLGAALFVRGLGLGAVLIPVMAVAYEDIEHAQMPDASALTRIAQQLGGAFGTAAVAATITSAGGSTGGFDAAFWETVAMAVVAMLASFALPARGAAPRR